MIESDTIKLLRECDAGIKMGIESINEVLKYVDDSRLHDVMMFKRRAVLDFSALPAFFVTNLLLVQCENHYFRRLIVSFNC